MFRKLYFILFQVSSFARRSSVLSDLHDVSQGSGFHLNPSAGVTQMQQFHLDSRRQQPYQTLDDVLINGKNEKKQQYYQLHSMNHHQYRPDPTPYQQEQSREPDREHHGDAKDVGMELEKVLDGGKVDLKLIQESTRPVNGTKSKLKIVKNKNKNGRIVIVMSKYMENGKPSQIQSVERGTDYVNSSAEGTKPSERNGFENGFRKNNINGQTETSENGIYKRHHSEPCGDQRGAQSFLSHRSISAPNASSSQGQSNGTSVNGHHGTTDLSDSCQDEPMDLSFSGSQRARNAPTDCRSNELSAPAETEMPLPTREPERAPSFTPFLGNIIITDITANCLTVTFKEYVPV